MDPPPPNCPKLLFQTAKPFEPKTLHWTIWLSDLTKMEEILEKGEHDINAKDKRGWTPLHQAVVNGFDEMVTTLLEYGADIEVQDEDGLSVLDWKSKIGHSKVKRLLDDAAQKRGNHQERASDVKEDHQGHASAVKEDRE